jgi:hypothetical protein
MGWAMFAAIMLMVGGAFAVINGIIGIADDEVLVKTKDWVFSIDTTTWGWIHLIVGIVVIMAGFGIFTGNVLARTVGVIVAVVSAIANFMWLPYYPVWSVVVIAINIAVIWALTAHGRDLARAG